MCVLATAGPEGPLATPVRYFHLDFAVMFSTAAGSPKMRNLAADPRASVGIFAPLVGQASSRGAQLFGQARVLSEDDRDFEHYRPAFRWQSDHVERSRSLDEPPTGPLVVIEPERIVHTEHWLRRGGSRRVSPGPARTRSRDPPAGSRIGQPALGGFHGPGPGRRGGRSWRRSR
ncbi:pyridoxamine 5'-phosphate oxidase family protein [Streptomyces sp. cmx-18-6]|uniref:pyridoxamine 5'-phosphate oxidase family protein n=1 Tax=Streptomyces sp. cmx-18-6 TaxID=2790930 RepID=UPI003980D0B1